MLKINDLNICFDKPLFTHQNIEIKNNCLTLIKGESGSGKTTLLYQLGLIDTKLKCQYFIDDQEISSMNSHDISQIKRDIIGFVFQEYMLYDQLSVYENFQYFASIVNKKINQNDINNYLKSVHLDIPIDRPLYTLSGGQKQRLAIACILIKNPQIIILDEPTSSLDQNNSKFIFEILNELKKNHMIIVSSHDKLAYEVCDEIIEIKEHEIKKIKSIDIDEKKIDLETRSHFNNSSYIFYLKKQFQTSSQIKRLLFMIHLVILLLFTGITLSSHYYLENAKSSISSSNPAMLYVPNLTHNDFETLQVEKAYPYYQTHVYLNGMSYSIIPYFDETQLKDLVWTHYYIGEEKGFYFSNSMYLDIKNIIVPKDNIEFIDDHNQIISFKYKGILFKGVSNVYENTDDYIYMHQDLIENNISSKNIKGYTLLTYSYDEYTNLKKETHLLGYQVKPFQEIKDIDQFIQYIMTIKRILTIIFIILSSLSLSYIYNNYLNNRKKEISLLKCFGHNSFEISFMLTIEILFYNIVSLLMICLILFIYHHSFYTILISNCFIIILTLIIITLKTNKMNPVNILRND